MVMLSIIVPVYNLAPYIKKCVQSIIEQTYKEWELLLIDDGSIDGSGVLCDELACMDSRITVFHLENGGVSRARNYGLKKAKGKYVAFVDGDDWIEPDMYAKMIEPMEAGMDITFCRFVREYQDRTVVHFENNLETLAKAPYDFSQIIYEYEMKEMDRQTLSNTVFGSVCRSLFKKKVIDKENLHFPENVKIAEDRLFLMSYLIWCERAALIESYDYHYRAEREGSAITSSTTGYQNGLFERKKGMLELEIPIIKQNLRLTVQQKKDLIIYEKYRLCFDVVVNEILFNDHYEKQLKYVFKDPFLKGVISKQAFIHMKRYGFTFKRRFLYLLIRMHLWKMIKYTLMGRRR